MVMVEALQEIVVVVVVVSETHTFLAIHTTDFNLTYEQPSIILDPVFIPLPLPLSLRGNGKGVPPHYKNFRRKLAIDKVHNTELRLLSECRPPSEGLVTSAQPRHSCSQRACGRVGQEGKDERKKGGTE